MPPETCEYHTLLVADIAVIKNNIEYIKDKMCNHVKEGEERGGFRDRLIIVEQNVSAVKKDYWKICIVSGIIGGLIGNLSPEIVSGLAKLIGLIK